MKGFFYLKKHALKERVRLMLSLGRLRINSNDVNTLTTKIKKINEQFSFSFIHLKNSILQKHWF